MAGGGHDLVLGTEPSYSLADVEELLRDHDDERIVRAIGHLYGVVISLAPVAAGPAGIALWPLLDVKNEFTDAVSHLLPFLVKKRKEPYVQRLRRLKAAVTTLVYVAYVEEACHCVRSWCASARPSSGPELADALTPDLLPDIVLQRPPPIGPFASFDRYREWARDVYVDLTQELVKQLEQAKLTPAPKGEIDDDLLINGALFRLEAAFVELCVNHDELLLWAQCDAILHGNDGLGERLGAVVDRQDDLDLGLARLQELTRQVVSASQPSPVPRQIAALHRTYANDLTSPISVSDERPAEGFRYPTKAAAFVPQRFSTVQYDGTQPGIHAEAFWEQQEVHEDVGLFLVRSFLAADSVHRPVLILGHPGSGKSLLSEMLAARLSPPFFTTIRVSLRDTDASLEVEDQISQAVRQATGQTIDWIQLSELAEAPPIVVFDGLDELLLATGNSHVSFLDRLARFQEREFLQERPVRIVVTSRLTLIHRMRVADRTCVVRLLDFSSEQQATWVDIWNRTNAAYFKKQRLRLFAVPRSKFVHALAGQPLLLLMLAIYDAYENSLADAAAGSRGELYESIVRKFVERERGKGTEDGGIFRSLDPDARAQIVTQDMDRLSIVALAMHKRARLFITKDELNADLVAYGMGEPSASEDRLALSTAELLLGSFFFIHRSSTKVDDESGYAFEFLHNTFGEFLLATLIAKRLRTRCQTNAALAATPFPEGANLARIEAAAYELPAELRDALQWHLLCMRPVVLEMLQELTARPEWPEALSQVSELFSRELRHCTSFGDNHTATFQQRAVECANILSLASVMPDQPCAIACEHWQHVIGLLRGALSFEEMTQLVSGFQTQVHDGVVEVSQAQVVLAASDFPAADHRAAVALSDGGLEATTRLANLDSMVPLVERLPAALVAEELLLASRVLRPAVWRRLPDKAARSLIEQLGRSARIGLDTYPNTAMAAFAASVALGGTFSWRDDMPRIFRRSLEGDVEPEPVADLVFDLMSDVRGYTVGLSKADLRRMSAIVTEGGPRQAVEHLDSTLIALCWLVSAAGRVSADDRRSVCHALIDGGLLRRIATDAPSFAWLPAAAFLSFRSGPLGAGELKTIEEDCLTAVTLGRTGSIAWLDVIRATWLLVLRRDRMTALCRDIERACGVWTLRDAALRLGELGPGGMRSGWLYLTRKSAEAAKARGLPERTFYEWARDFA